MLHDLRYAFRMMGKHRLFTGVAVLALGLGIGANTAIFSVINGVVLRPLPYHDPDQLVTILHDGMKPVAPANYFDLAQQSQSFAAIGRGAMVGAKSQRPRRARTPAWAATHREDVSSAGR